MCICRLNWVLTGVVVLGVLTTGLQAAIVSVTFDEPGYVAGQLPPVPWWQEYNATAHYVTAGEGYQGSQALALPAQSQWAGVTYDFSTPLTSDMGALSISMLFKPRSGYHPVAQYMVFGGMDIGRGSKRYDTGVGMSLIFRKVAGVYRIYGPGGGPNGALMGGFALEQWYELTFAVNDAWDTVTLSAGPVGATPLSMTYGWDGGPIDRIWVLPPIDGNPALYDNLLVVPEPAAMGVLTLVGLGIMRRRRAA